MSIRFLTAGESHGECLSAIIEGIPYGYKLNFDFINKELSARQKGFGRGGRMQIEKDVIKITSGVRHGITMASPIALIIKNRDWGNWLLPMSVEELDSSLLDEAMLNDIENKKIKNFRPAHADLAGVLKYGFDDIRNVLERSSARETATRVAVGAIAQNILSNYNIKFESEVLSIGQCADKSKFEEYVNQYKEKGDSLGGIVKVTIKNVVAGLGSFTHWDKRLDGRLSGAIMSIPAVKSVEIGLGKEYARLSGSITHDEIFYDKKYYHKSNNSGGIEGGISNGEDIVITLAMKPIPTMKHTLNSVEIKTHNKVSAHFERSDNCAVEACGVVARNMSALVILDAFLDKFSSDSKQDIDTNYSNYLKRLNEI